jgi:hypothetical protein
MSERIKWTMGDWCIDTASIKGTHGETVAYIERQSSGNVPSGYTASDEQWQSIIDQIAAVPEMIAALRNVQHELKHDGEVLHVTRCDIDSLLKRVDPPCPVTRTVNVTMQVDVRVFSDAPEDVVRAMALAQVRKGDGFVTGGKVIS